MRYFQFYCCQMLVEMVCCNGCGFFLCPILDIPTEIDNYHALCLLEALAIHQKLPLPSSTYKATHKTTGIKYCLRRLHGTFCLYSITSMFFFLYWKPSNCFRFYLRFSATVHQMYVCCRIMEKVLPFECRSTARIVYNKAIRWPMWVLFHSSSSSSCRAAGVMFIYIP